MFDYARIALAVPEVSVGGVKENTEKIIGKIKEANEKKADFIVFPELSVTGYTCADLFFQKTLLENAVLSLNKIAHLSEDVDAVIIAGAPLQIGGKLFDCACVFSGGRICALIPKTLLSESEKRWFSSPDELGIKEIMSEEIGVYPSYKIPVSPYIVLEGKEGVKFAVEAGDTLGAPVNTGAYLSLCGAQIVFNICASKEIVAKREFALNEAKSLSSKGINVYASVSAGKSESTSDAVYSGKSIVAENGKIVSENENFIDGDYILFSDVDLGKIKADKIKKKDFSAEAKKLFCDRDVQNVRLYGVNPYKSKLRSDGKLAKIKKMPFVPSDKEELRKRCLAIFDMQVAGLEKRLDKAAEKAIVGVSGGLDSTLALLVSVKAMEKLGRKSENVIGITMPGFGTTSRTHDNAWNLMKELGIETREISIKESCLKHFEDIGHDAEVHDVTYENAQARERTQILMDVANKNNALVCGTGDLSEIALGWCTYNGDHMSMYGVNSGVPKTLLRWMIETIAESGIFGEKAGEILKDIAATPISPELLPPDKDGKMTQKTEDSVGPYALHDFFTYYAVRYGFSPEKIYVLANRAFEDEFDAETVKKWLKVFCKRFFTQQFKRSCSPDGIKIGSVGLSPKGEWIMASDADFSDWTGIIDRL